MSFPYNRALIPINNPTHRTTAHQYFLTLSHLIGKPIKQKMISRCQKLLIITNRINKRKSRNSPLGQIEISDSSHLSDILLFIYQVIFHQCPITFKIGVEFLSFFGDEGHITSHSCSVADPFDYV